MQTQRKWHAECRGTKTVPIWGKLLDPMEVVTLWLAIDPSTTENGCMKVILTAIIMVTAIMILLRTKRRCSPGISVRGRWTKIAPCPVFLNAVPTACTMRKPSSGSAKNTSRHAPLRLHHALCQHGFTFSPEHAYRPEHQIYLARGKDIAGNSYGDPSKPNEAWIQAYGFDIPKGH